MSDVWIAGQAKLIAGKLIDVDVDVEAIIGKAQRWGLKIQAIRNAAAQE